MRLNIEFTKEEIQRLIYYSTLVEDQDRPKPYWKRHEVILEKLCGALEEADLNLPIIKRNKPHKDRLSSREIRTQCK